jgi:Tfp pilus assembly protein PilF
MPKTTICMNRQFHFRFLFLCLSFCLVLTQSTQAQQTLPPFTSGNNEWNADSLGNIRAVVEVPAACQVAKVLLPWRRSDKDPAAKRIIIEDAATHRPIDRFSADRIDNESGEISFEPASGKGTYYIYYMPYRNEGRSNYPKGVYLTPAPATPVADPTAFNARVTAIQSINAFNSVYPMEVIATAKETAATVRASGRKDYLVFPEERRFPIRMTDHLPARWTNRRYAASFTDSAGKGEHYSWQIGIYALQDLSSLTLEFSDLRSDKNAGVKTLSDKSPLIPKSAFSCLNTHGIDYTGKPFDKEVSVAAGKVQALWCLVDIPKTTPAGLYKGTVTIRSAGHSATTVAIRLFIKDSLLADGGISDPSNQTRLHWLNSTLMQDNTVIAPYTPLQIEGSSISLLGRRLTIGTDGLPSRIETFFTPEMTGYTKTPNELLSAPIHFDCLDEGGRKMVFTDAAPTFTTTQPGTVEWAASAVNPNLRMDISGHLEFDGFLQYTVKMTALSDVDLQDVDMVIPFRQPMARYMMGLGLKGGDCPKQFDWKWNVAEKNQDGAWIGAVNAGLQYSLRDENYSRPLNTNFYLQKPLLLPSSWGNENKGGISLNTADSSAQVRNFSGSRRLKKGDTLFYNVTFLITPFHPINTDFQWSTRFYHRYNDIDSIASTGATVINIHHNTPINPWINYPFIEWRAMKDYIDEAHAKGLKVKIYNTVRELSDRAYELFPMRSLGHEIYSAGKGGGFSWLQEHVKDDYIPAWFVPQIKDAAIINSGMSRWHNYYVEGMNWLVQNVGIDGIYLDDVAFDRVTMKRIKRVLILDGHPGIIDLHSANQYNPRDGFNNSANLYMEHFPYLNRLWFGEYFDYEKNDPSFFLTEVSGIPFGLMGEMLQGGGNPWRGMIYGMTNRMPWSDHADPRPIWKVWDRFGMQGSAMLGYWSPSCPARTDNPRVLATVYKKKDSSLVAIASWAAEDTTVRLSVDWKQLGIDPATAVFTAPEISNFQPSATFHPGDRITVQKGKGWLLILSTPPAAATTPPAAAATASTLTFPAAATPHLSGPAANPPAAAAPHPATITEYRQSFPTYPFSDPNPIPLMSAVYPYFRYDGFSATPIQKQWKIVALENDYIRLLITPEIGGKVWAAIEKKTNRPFLYFNHSVKFRDIAMRGPWTSGGLEANYGIIGHTPACSTPVDYLTRTNEDGSVSCFVGTLDLLTRSYWRVEIRLPKDQASFTTRSFWYNTTPMEQPYYSWMNAGLPAGSDLQFIYPGNRFLGHNGEYAAWPYDSTRKKDISWYRNNDFGGPKSYHVFGKYTDFAGAYWHDAGLGMVRYGTHDDKPGKKIWIWGLSRQGMIWEHLLTDTDGQYVELQSGRLFNQNAPASTRTPFKHRSFAPYGTDSWTEYWYPVLGTQGFVAASEFGALNLRHDGNKLHIWLSPARAIDDTLRITAGNTTIYQRPIHAAPLSLFTDSVVTSVNPDSLVAVLGDQLLHYSAAPDANTLSRPVDAPADFDWTSNYGYYLKGTEAVDQKDYAQAELAFDSALQKDSNFLPALVASANLAWRNMKYAQALTLARRALSINTEDGGANYIYGLANDRLGNNVDARDGFDIAAMDPAFRSAAYTSLARLYVREGNIPRALASTEKALAAQPQNIDALQIQAVINRLQGDAPRHTAVLSALLKLDPLNFFALFEQHSASFASLIRSELPQETYLELAIWYANCGQNSDAIRVLQLSPPVAEVRIWLAYLTHQRLDVATLDPVRAFPFRSETAAILERLLHDTGNTGNTGTSGNTGNTDSWFLRYQLALIYNDRNRHTEAQQLLAGCADAPPYAPFYAFRAAMAPAADSAQALHDLERAATLDSQWRYQKLLSEYFVAHHDPARAEVIAGGYYKAHTADYRIGMLYAKTLLVNGRYAECDALLGRLNILPFEGAKEGHELYREALLMEAVQSMRMHQYKKALAFIDRAKKWPENLGAGEPYPQDQDLRLENWMSARCTAAIQKTATPTLTDSLRESPGSATNMHVLQAIQGSSAGGIR